ncbi:MAG: hypothetical protein O3A38_09495 [Proteobacteria bacterium]|nr:hypothetical protein [Pseudomonadota bacterium]
MKNLPFSSTPSWVINSTSALILGVAFTFAELIIAMAVTIPNS